MLRTFLTSTIPFEQAVYGSFPFWQRGYDLLAASKGCRATWLKELCEACQNYGERPRGAAEAGGLFAKPLSDGAWMIVGPSAQGADDQGRPGAVAFHALFLTWADYRKAGANPFVFAGALRRDWGPETQTQALPSGAWSLPLAKKVDSSASEQAFKIAKVLRQGNRVALESTEPINQLAEAVWNALPSRHRKRASVATWAFRNGSRFDLVALPRLTDADVDETYVDPFSPVHELSPENAIETATKPALILDASQFTLDRPSAFRNFWAFHRRLLFALAGSIIFMTIIIVVFQFFGGNQVDRTKANPISQTIPEPARDRYRAADSQIDAEDRARVIMGLVDLAERFQVVEVDQFSQTADPAALMLLLADRLRYPGPWLSNSELQALAQEPEGDRALAWDAQLRRFANDRPLPADFRSGPLRWQLDTLAWSFHIKPDPRLSAAEVPHILAEKLANDRTIRPHPLADRYPTLNHYADFLSQLPRR